MSDDLRGAAEMLGIRSAPGGMLTIARGTHVVHAATDDGIVHLAELTIRSVDDYTLAFACRRLLVDRYGGALAHLRRPGDLVDCMACLVRGVGR